MEELAATGVVGFSDDGAADRIPRLARGADDLPGAAGPAADRARRGPAARGRDADARRPDGHTPGPGRLAGERGADRAWSATSPWPPRPGARLHLTHLSTAASLEAVRRAKQRGLPVTCDVTPHHLAMTDAWVAGDRTFAWDEATRAPDAFEAALDPTLAYDGRTPRQSTARLAGRRAGAAGRRGRRHRRRHRHRPCAAPARAQGGRVRQRRAGHDRAGDRAGRGAGGGRRGQAGADDADRRAQHPSRPRSSASREPWPRASPPTWWSSTRGRPGASRPRRSPHARRTRRCSAWSCPAWCG